MKEACNLFYSPARRDFCLKQQKIRWQNLKFLNIMSQTNGRCMPCWQPPSLIYSLLTFTEIHVLGYQNQVYNYIHLCSRCSVELFRDIGGFPPLSLIPQLIDKASHCTLNTLYDVLYSVYWSHTEWMPSQDIDWSRMYGEWIFVFE